MMSNITDIRLDDQIEYEHESNGRRECVRPELSPELTSDAASLVQMGRALCRPGVGVQLGGPSEDDKPFRGSRLIGIDG